jgi:hypothetical protein
VVVLVELVVVGVVVVVGMGVVLLVVSFPPPESDAITTTATMRPMTAATRSARAHFTPRLMPPPGGWPDGGCCSGCPM